MSWRRRNLSRAKPGLQADAAGRVHNFNPGPAVLPLPVLERARDELLSYDGSGMSVLEMSHRSPQFEGILARAEADLRSLLTIPDNYRVLFLQGGRVCSPDGADEPARAGSVSRLYPDRLVG
jgi:phosphoserine aminotransferase